MFTERYQQPLAAYEEFWNREKRRRCVLNVCAPFDGVPYRPYTDLQERWLDEEYIYRKFKHDTANTYFTAEGVPMLFTNLGPGTLSACIGGSFVLAPNTIWFDRDPVVKEWADAAKVAFDENSEMWQALLRLQRKFATDNDVHFSMTDIGGVMDIVSSLRSADQLLFDLYDDPDEVKALTELVTKLWFDAYDQQVETVRKAGTPYNTWMNIPSALPWYPIQSDFCAMISPRHFEEFILPHIVEQVNYMERSIYHLDGPGELPHLDMLLDIPNLTGIQWVAGDGQPPLWDDVWIDVYRRIQDKKKNIVLHDGISEYNLEGAERLIKSIDPTGVYISFACSSPQKAEEIVDKIERWSR